MPLVSVKLGMYGLIRDVNYAKAFVVHVQMANVINVLRPIMVIRLIAIIVMLDALHVQIIKFVHHVNPPNTSLYKLHVNNALFLA